MFDNLPAHKRGDARWAGERRGAWLLFLPPCSPDFNPMELAFSKFKAHMKRLKPHTFDNLWKAAGRVCDLFKPEECMNFFAADEDATEYLGIALEPRRQDASNTEGEREHTR